MASVALPGTLRPTARVRHRLAILLACLGTLPLSAHPEIEEALLRFDARLSAAPTDARLYQERGELHAQHGDLLAAHGDFLHAARLAPDLPGLHRARGALALQKGQPAAARDFLNQAVAQQPDDAEALVLRARAHAALGERTAAVADLDRALAFIVVPSPELLLIRADWDPSPVSAIRAIDAGLDRLGPVPALITRAVALEESVGQIDAARDRLDDVIRRAERPEAWLKARGDLLARAGRAADAQQSYAAARTALARLPAWLRESPDVLALSAELDPLTSLP